MKREVIIIKEIIARKKTLLCRVAVILGFCIFYLSGFSWLENRHVSGIHITACALDYKIPFQEIFIIPYLLWFVYIAATVIYFLLHEDENFNALAGTLALGMTLFLVVSAIYPNGLNLRPVTFERDNIFIIRTIHRPMYCQVFMYTIHLLPLWRSKEASLPGNKKAGHGALVF